VCAMGNNGSQTAIEPAIWYRCISVAALQQTGALAGFSNRGKHTDVAAPGVAIISTMPTYPVTMNTKYGYFHNYDAASGTSMASPMVAGLVGLMLSKNPALGPSQVEGILQATAGDGQTFSDMGFGNVNAAKAVAATTPSDTTAPTVAITSPASGANVSRLVTVQASPKDNVGVHHVDFVSAGERFTAPGTAVNNYAGSWISTTQWNGSQSISAIATDASGNRSGLQTASFNVQNAYHTRQFTAKLCFPAKSDCPDYTGKVPLGETLELPAVVREDMTWTAELTNRPHLLPVNYLFSCQGSSWTFQMDLKSRGSISWYPRLTFCGGALAANNATGAAIAYWSDNRGSAVVNYTWTVTYPQ
jgi:hypothetical protein